MEYLPEQVVISLEKGIRNYCMRWSSPLTGQLFEEILVSAYKKNKWDVSWNAGSHEQGTDIVINKDEIKRKISVKGNKCDKKYINVSSYRTTTYKTIEEKCKFIDKQSENFDHYIILCREEKIVKKKLESITYNVFVLDSGFIKATDCNWIETRTGWKTTLNGINMNIQKAMSDQLWLKIPREKLNKLLSITLKADEIATINLCD
jgi:hypothetical protein